MSGKTQLDSGIDAEKAKLADLTGDQDHEVIGYGVTYVVGAEWSALTPRDWLMDQMEDIGLPDDIAPPQPTPRKAYSRTIEHMTKHWLDDYFVEAPRADNGVEEEHRVTVDIKEGEGRRWHHVRGEVFFDEEESGTEGGEWRQFHLGDIFYDDESNRLIARADDDLSEDDYLAPVWKDVSEGARNLHKEFQHTHTATDMRDMIYRVVRRYTQNVIKLQRSVYLFPAAMIDFVEDLAELFDRINESYKERGEPMAIRTFEILDTPDKQAWVEAAVTQTLEKAVDDIVEEALDAFDEGEAAAEAVDAIKADINAEASETAEIYNGLLDAEISIEDALERQKEQLSDDEKTEIVDDVIAQANLDDFEADDDEAEPVEA
ncbi:hypothetical protein Z052_01855 [Halorubrum sp. C191]|uniref:DUF6744 family protein n=1 Tax=Halorubrum sp. C191 TaxID=1383842 RepID=UPI000C08483A|nr:DUF6744 family protein [Halorubrum sp. C191]PHQ43907.1 hypothetical protein Z052_01855 [Halorubrum sp. C191]